MNDIPDEIRKMFPNQSIHKLDIDNNNELHVLASAEPLEKEPDFDNMSTAQVDQYLHEHGYDPESVRSDGEILTGALLENIYLKERAEKAEEKINKQEIYIGKLEEKLPKLNVDLAKASLRAEKAEARIKELENIIRGMFPLWIAAMGWAEHGRAADLDRIRNYYNGHGNPLTSADIHLIFQVVEIKAASTRRR